MRIPAGICRWRLILLAATLIAACCPLASAQELKFQPGCTLPFQAIAEQREIDETCGIEGLDNETNSRQRAQNRAKNNLCATGQPVPLTHNAFVKLQQAAEAKQIHGLPDDRSVLKDLVTTGGKLVGEGSVVSYVAYIIDAHPSNTHKGEKVNCKKSGQANNDIHIVLGRSTEEDPCDTVAAQVIPHFRPDAWADLAHHNIEKHPVRVTGHLFFDGSHKPCKEGRGRPARVSVWEIHPVYAIEVCKKTKLKACKSGGPWVSLHEWFGLQDEEEDNQ